MHLTPFKRKTGSSAYAACSDPYTEVGASEVGDEEQALVDPGD
jgi:hypothetical protein